MDFQANSPKATSNIAVTIGKWKVLASAGPEYPLNTATAAIAKKQALPVRVARVSRSTTSSASRAGTRLL